MELDWLVKANKIKKWDRQFPVEIRNTKTGEFLRRHEVDFRVHELDGSFTLIETKGFETRDWKMVRDEIEVLWLPEHLDYHYEVEKQL